MADATARLSVDLAATSEVPADQLEALAVRLRSELLERGAARVERVPAGPAPDGTRSGEVAGIVALVATGIQTAAALAEIIQFVQEWRSGDRRWQGVRLRINGREIPQAVDEPESRRLVASLTAERTDRLVGVRDALIVACARYDDPGLRQLRSPSHDARALADVLGNPSIGGFQVSLLADADERTVRRRIAAFLADRDRDDVLLVHFSGHGLKDNLGHLHLAATDTEVKALAATAVPAAFISDQMSQSAARQIVLVLDCCFSGAFARGTTTRGDRTVHLGEAFAGSGRIVLTASSATEYAFDGDQLTESEARPSIFTEALANGLATGLADLDEDGVIGVDELFTYAERRVRNSGTGQAPMIWTYGMSGRIVVARSIRPSTLPAEIRQDLDSDRVVLRMEGVRRLGEIWAGPAGELRTAAETKLRTVASGDDSMQVRAAATAILEGRPAATAPAAGTGVSSTDGQRVGRPAPRPGSAPAARRVGSRSLHTLRIGGFGAVLGVALWLLVYLFRYDTTQAWERPGLQQMLFESLLMLALGGVGIALLAAGPGRRTLPAVVVVGASGWLYATALAVFWRMPAIDIVGAGWWVDAAAGLVITAAVTMIVLGTIRSVNGPSVEGWRAVLLGLLVAAESIYVSRFTPSAWYNYQLAGGLLGATWVAIVARHASPRTTSWLVAGWAAAGLVHLTSWQLLDYYGHPAATPVSWLAPIAALVVSAWQLRRRHTADGVGE
jgi:hypothetical protein